MGVRSQNDVLLLLGAFTHEENNMKN